jgi:penicillin-binding protein 1A
VTSPPTIRADLAHQHRRVLSRWLRALLAVVFALVLAAGLSGLWAWKLVFADLPPIASKAVLWSLNRPPGVTFLDRDGGLLAVRGPRHGQAVGLHELPAYVPHAFLAAEDRRFYAHHGVDFEGVARAAWADVGAHHVVQGGSTITQQVARNVFLNADQTLKRKLQEAALAWRIERMMSKDEILELYLNRIYFGGGAYGVEAASETYFGKSARNLTLSEAAVLAALPKAPSRLDPVNDLDAALARAHTILTEMRQDGWITEAERQAALQAPPKLAPERPEEGDFGYVLDLAASRARELAENRAPDLIVRLTVDPKLQATAAQVVRDGVAQGKALGANQAALVALSPDGAIRALVGGRDHRESAFNRATQALRQPGSSFKPFVYAAALEAGVRPEDVRTDSPVNFHGWSPGNYGGHYSGAVTVADALARSINTVAVKLTHQVGADKVAALAQRFGLTMIPAKPNLSIGLGAYEVDLLDLVSGYQVFQQDGRHPEPFIIETITNAHGDVLYQHPSVPPPQVYDAPHNRLMVKMMEGVIARGTGTKADIGRPAAGKTGTSQTWRDAWFVGFTPDWIAGVWVGDDKSRPMAKVAGGELPAEMWRRFMLVAHADTPVHDFPPLLPVPEVQKPATPGAPAPDHMDETDEPGPPEIAADQPPAEGPPAQPPGPPQNPRQSFYSGLADDFGQAAGDSGPQQQQP